MSQVNIKSWKASIKGVENLQIDLNTPFPKITEDNQIIVKVLAVGLNPADWKYAEGFLPIPFPFSIGLDASGIVHQLGANVDPAKFQKDKTIVFFWGQFGLGTFQEYLVVDSRYITVVPQEFHKHLENDIKKFAIKLAALPCAGITAYRTVVQSLNLFPSKEHRKNNFKVIRNIGVSAGAGGCGIFELQLLKLWKESLPQEQKQNVKIITTCSSKNNDFVKKFGADYTVDYKTEDVKKRILEITENKPLDVWIENADEKSGLIGLELLGYGGQFATIVGNITQAQLALIKPFQCISVHSVVGADSSQQDHEQRLEQKFILDELLKLVHEGKIDTGVTEVLPFDKLKEGLLKIKQGAIRGKLVAEL